MASNHGASSAIVFPNLALFETATSWLTFHALPLAADESVVEMRVRAMPEAVGRLEAMAPVEGERPDYVISAEGPLGWDKVPDANVHT